MPIIGSHPWAWLRMSLALCILTISGIGTLVAQESDPSEDSARGIVSGRTGIPAEDLEITNRADAIYPLQGVSATAFKIDDPNGDSHRVLVDENGVELDSDALEAAEEAHYARRYGRLDPRLHDLLQKTPANTPVDVIVWLHEPPGRQASRPTLTTDPNAAKPSEADVEKIYSDVDAQRAAEVAAVVNPVAHKLAPYGYPVETDAYAPALFASLPPELILEINTWPEVQRIYEAPINATELSVAVPTVLGNVVHGRGINGAGVRVAQIEVGGRVAVANPSLAGTLQDAISVCAAASGHSTGVAGIIRSTHGVHRGAAPGATLRAGGSCGGVSAQLMAASTRAMDWNARALNLSWGANIGLTPGPLDRFYDNAVLNRWRTVVKSAGNEAGPCGSGTGNITSPGLAYNVISVGNFDDANTTAWGGDFMNACSSWRDPVSWMNDREKPEVAAPGSNINSTTTAFPWTGPIGSGTSFAAPLVTGATALMIQRNGFFSVWPEAVKALLMVTAVHNIEGATRLSERDGAGGIALDRVDDVAGGVTGGASGQGYNCASPVNIDVALPWLASGILTRIAIVWDNDPAYVNYATRPSADLDLRILSPGGATVASSASWDNTYEIVEFTPTTTGFHRIRVNKFRCDRSPQWLGWAWRQGN